MAKRNAVVTFILGAAALSYMFFYFHKEEELSTTLRLRWLHQAQFAGIYTAQEKGFFQKEGVSVEINPAGPGINFMQLVGTGSEEFGICGAAQILEARDKDLPVVAIAVIFQGNPNIFFAKKSSGIQDVKGWSGKTVAYQQGYDIEYVFRAMVEDAAIDENSIKKYPAKFDMTPFFTDEVDVWAGYRINQPFVAEEKGVEIVRFYPEEYGVYMAGDCVFTTEEIIRTKPELCQKVVNAILKGWQEALNDKALAVKITLQYNTSGDLVHETNMINEIEKLVYPANVERKIGSMNYDQWDTMLRIWKKYGGIKKDLNLNKCFDTKFVEKYHQLN